MLVTQWLFSLNYDPYESIEFVTNSHLGNFSLLTLDPVLLDIS